MTINSMLLSQGFLTCVFEKVDLVRKGLAKFEEKGKIKRMSEIKVNKNCIMYMDI